MRHIVNPLVRASANSPLGRATGRLSVLQFKGKRTGRSYAIPVLVHLIDGSPTVFTPGSWAANFLGGQVVTVVRRGRSQLAVGELLQDAGDVGPALRAALAQAGSPRQLGLAVDAGHEPTDAELSAVRKMIRLTPTQQRT